jgi:hypothetical protein
MELPQLPQSVKSLISDVVYTDEELEKLFDESSDKDLEIQLVYSLYGAVPLTPTVLKSIAGKKVHGLTGQAFLEMKNRLEKMNRIESFIVDPRSDTRASITYGSDGESYEIYLYEGIYRTGSGADAIYVYV